MPLGLQTKDQALCSELAAELLEPIDAQLPLDVQFELYMSKAVYLNSLLRSYNQSLQKISCRSFSLSHSQEISLFEKSDVFILKKALSHTESEMRRLVFKSLQEALERVTLKRKKNAFRE